MFSTTEKKTHFGQFNVLLQGPAKCGKTTFASSFVVDGKPPAFIATEDGHHALEPSRDVSRVNNWEEFRKLVAYIEKNKAEMQSKYSCFVIDLVSDLSHYCEDFVRTRKNIEDIADLEWGKGFNLVAREFRTQTNKLFASMPVTFITHIKLREVEEMGKNKEKYAPDLPKKIFNYLNGKCDLIAFIIPSASSDKQPVLSMLPNDKYLAGTRIRSLAKRFALDTQDMQKSFKTIEAAIK